LRRARLRPDARALHYARRLCLHGSLAFLDSTRALARGFSRPCSSPDGLAGLLDGQILGWAMALFTRRCEVLCVSCCALVTHHALPISQPVKNTSTPPTIT